MENNRQTLYRYNAVSYKWHLIIHAMVLVHSMKVFTNYSL